MVLETIAGKTRAEKVCAYQVLLSFKTSVTSEFFLIHAGQLCPLVKQRSSDITRFFAGHCHISGANIQACGTFTLGTI